MGLVDGANEVKELAIPGIKRERFRINGDNSKILELNTSDANIVKRLNEAYPRLTALADKVTEIADVEDEADEDEFNALAEKLSEIDTEMKAEVDYIFDSNVSEVCLGNASMYEPKDGKFAWEHILEAVGSLYENSIREEFDKMDKRVEKHTKKYTKKANNG